MQGLAHDEQSPTDLTHRFLLLAGVLLHRYGTPAHRLERVMVRLSQSLGVKGTYLYTPTALIVSIFDHQGERSYVRRVDSGLVDVDKLIRFDETLERVESGELGILEAETELAMIDASPPPFPQFVTLIACSVSCAAVAVFFRGGGQEVLASSVIGLIVAFVEWIGLRGNWERGLLEPVAGLVAASCALGLCRSGMQIDDRLVTLAGLIVLVPGLSLTIGLTELAVGHLSAGVARIAGAGVSMLTMSVGVALGWSLVGGWRDLPTQAVWPLPEWSQVVAICVAPICFGIVFRASWRQWPWIVFVTTMGFASSYFASAQWGTQTGAFLGAFAVGIGSNLYARVLDRPALVPLTPGMLVLVPGSLGYRALTAFIDHETIAGVDAASSMLIIAAALVGGILTANVVLPPKRIL